METGILIEAVDPRRADVAALLEQADRYLLDRYPPELCFLDDVEALTAGNATLLGAFAGKTLVGMGALKLLRDREDYGEVKRLFVATGARGQGLGRRLMAALEAELWRHRIELMRLETGTRQPEAIALYQSLGYRLRGPYGDYPDNPLSVFMEKRLQDQPASDRHGSQFT